MVNANLIISVSAVLVGAILAAALMLHSSDSSVDAVVRDMRAACDTLPSDDVCFEGITAENVQDYGIGGPADVLPCASSCHGAVDWLVDYNGGDAFADIQCSDLDDYSDSIGTFTFNSITSPDHSMQYLVEQACLSVDRRVTFEEEQAHRKLIRNYGCCSMALSFLIGGDDTADCFNDNVRSRIHNGRGPSVACIAHDKCLHHCSENLDECSSGSNVCKCYGECDWDLHTNVDKPSKTEGGCEWWEWNCLAVTYVIKGIMWSTPNDP